MSVGEQGLIRQSQLRGTFGFSNLEEQIEFMMASSISYVYTQSTPQTEWVVVHNYNKYPKVTVLDSDNGLVEPYIHYDSLNQVTIRFSEPVSGKAVLQYVRTYTYTHVQDIADTTWTVQHNLNRIPEITIVDDKGEIVRPSINYVSLDQIVITFSVPMAGIVYVQ